MTDRPINLTAPDVQALLGGRKTQHRVVLERLRIRRKWTTVTEFGPSTTEGYDWHFRDSEMRWHDLRHDELLAALPCKPRDRLWVRENFAEVGSVDPPWVLYRASGYRAECFRHGMDNFPPENEAPWRSSATMRRSLSRITLTVTDVRVQRVQEISEADAIAEGARPFFDKADVEMMGSPNGGQIPMMPLKGPTDAYQKAWNNRHKPAQWTENPWVCALTFDVVRRNIDEVK